MNLSNPKSIGKSIEVKVHTRPIKIAYIIPNINEPNTHKLIDAIFHESYTRWAGAYTLIIPIDIHGTIPEDYEHWLKHIDPDFIHSYVELKKSTIQKIDKLCCPIALTQYITDTKNDDSTWKSYTTNWHNHFTPVSSSTTVPSPNNTPIFPLEKEAESEIFIITEFNKNDSRIIRDNFGIAFHTMINTHEIPGLYKTLCLVSPDTPDSINAGTSRCTSFEEILIEINNKRAAPISKFSMLHSETIPKTNPYQWSHCFNIFIGDSVHDRINFWNSRHFVPDHAEKPGALIFEKNNFNNEAMLIQLGEFLNKHNFLHINGGPYIVSLRSYSHTQKELEFIQKKLQPHTYNSITVNDFYNAPAVPEKVDLEGIRSRECDPTTFKITEDINTLQANPPEHFTYIPPSHRDIAEGQWIVELDIQRHNSLSRYSNTIDSWDLPRRQKITAAFSGNMGKITTHYKLAILPKCNSDFSPSYHSTIKEYFYELKLPDDETFFKHLVLDLRLGSGLGPGYDIRSSLDKKSYRKLSISDKGQYLRGVISMFDNLHNAHSILTNSYWRKILREAKLDADRSLEFNIQQLKNFLNTDKQKKEKLKNELRFESIKKVTKWMNDSLLDTLDHLIKINIFHQVHSWRCLYCGHSNTRSIDNIKTKNTCDICANEHYVSTDLDWSYKINKFVYNSLVKYNGLPVLWTLGLLNKKSRGSFYYLPEVDLYKNDTKENSNEIDILCLVDGVFYAVEVKKSMSSFIKEKKEIDSFIDEINLIKPDVAMLSFERYYNDVETNIGDIVDEIEKVITPHVKSDLPNIVSDIEKRIYPHIKSNEEIDDEEDIKKIFSTIAEQIEKSIHPVKLEVIIAARDDPEFNNHPANLGIYGDRIHKNW